MEVKLEKPEAFAGRSGRRSFICLDDLSEFGETSKSTFGRADNEQDGDRIPGGCAMAAQLRVFPATLDAPAPESPPPVVRVRLGDLLPLVTLAQRQNYLWLHDFLDDEVAITSDLYEILRAFRCYRPSA
jgi:hypothetical protein